MNNNRRSPRPVTRKLTVLALSLVLAVTCLSARSQDTTAPSVMLRSVDAQPAPDGSGTWVTFHGDNPIPYSLSPIAGGTWTMTMDGVDCRESLRNGRGRKWVAWCSPPVPGKGRPATVWSSWPRMAPDGGFAWMKRPDGAGRPPAKSLRPPSRAGGRARCGRLDPSVVPARARIRR
jgi:hypothetical protein